MMRTELKGIIQLIFCVLCLGLATACQSAPVSSSSTTLPTAAGETYDGDYRLGPADQLRVTVFGHESTNNSYRSGAENHNPEAGEGNWTDRKQAAVQAYLEWMPVRDPEVGKAREALYRRFDFGDVASVMKVLWKRPGIGASEIVDALDGEQDWSPRTVKTLLSRLVEKGALDTEADGRRYLYRPTVAKRDYQKKEAGQLIDKLFGGRAAPLVAQLADARGLSNDDIEELEALLGRLKQ